MKTFLIITMVILSAVVSACGQVQVTPSTPTLVLATSAKDIVGVWVPPANNYSLDFKEDGTGEEGPLVNGNRVSIEDVFQFRFEGTRLTFQEKSGTACADKPNIYEIQLLASDKIQFVKIHDDCVARYALLSVPLHKFP